MSEWKPHGGLRDDKSEELCDDCEGTSQCLLCCGALEPEEERMDSPPMIQIVRIVVSLTCDGTGLVDA